MNVSMKDLVIIEHALQEFIANSRDEGSSMKYQQVLEHLQYQRKHMFESQTITGTNLDGIRYDYDDSVNMHEPRH